jgi:hypothetical protein
MGCSFNCVPVPPEIQKVNELKKFYNDYKNNLLKQYGEEFEGYSGDLAVDSGLVIKKNLKIESDVELNGKNIDKYWDDLLNLCTNHCEKWGPSIAVKFGKQWVICGAYSD